MQKEIEQHVVMAKQGSHKDMDIVFGAFKNNIESCARKLATSGFDFDDAVTDICRKMIVRHPHVFADVTAKTSDVVLDNWDKIKAAGHALAKQLEPVFKALKKTFNSVKKTIVNGVKAIWSHFMQAVGKIRKPINSIKKHFNELTQTKAFKIFVTFMKDNFVARIKTYLSIVEGVFTAVWTAVVGIVSAAVDTLGGVINGVMTVFDGLITFITGVFTGNWRQAWEGVKKIFSGIFESLTSVLKGVMNAVISVINGAISGINKITGGLEKAAQKAV